MNSKLKKQMEDDMKQFLDNIESQSHGDRVVTLRNLLEKYVHLNTCDYMMDHFDLQSIVGSAKTKFSNDKMPIFLGEKKRQVMQSELPHMMMIEATIGWLNKNNCLKRLPKFDKREDKF